MTLLFIPAVSFAVNDFVGTYSCTGMDPYLNKKYTGKVIVRQQHAVYSLEMIYDTGEKYRGTGGQYNPTLMSVVFQDINNPKKVGLEQYGFYNGDLNTMQGYWVYLGEDKLGTEVCKRDVPLPANK